MVAKPLGTLIPCGVSSRYISPSDAFLPPTSGTSSMPISSKKRMYLPMLFMRVCLLWVVFFWQAAIQLPDVLYYRLSGSCILTGVSYCSVSRQGETERGALEQKRLVVADAIPGEGNDSVNQLRQVRRPLLRYAGSGY